jgi:DNA modification methylase
LINNIKTILLSYKNKGDRMIPITCDVKDYLKLDELKELQGELKTIDAKNLTKLKKRIVQSGLNVPFFIWKDDNTNYILDGHQRKKALTSLIKDDGFTVDKVPVVYIDANDIKDAKEKLLAITSQYGTMDAKYLINEFAEDIELKDFRLTNKEIYIDYVSKETNNDDKLPEMESTQTISQEGTIWQLNKHKLICGSSTDDDTYKRLLGGDRVNTYVTDPPYNMNYKGSGGDRSMGALIANDNIPNFDLFMTDFLTLMKKYGDKPSYYIFMGREEYYNLRKLFQEIIGHVASDIIWKKHRKGFGGGDYQKEYENLLYAAPGYERVLYGWNKNEKHWFTDDRTQTDVWEERSPNGLTKSFHPTMKPVNLLVTPIQNSSDEGMIVADIFNGSGSTLIATEKTKRVYRGIELEPKYVDLTVARWKLWMDENGRDVEILKDGEPFDFSVLENMYNMTDVGARLEL